MPSAFVPLEDLEGKKNNRCSDDHLKTTAISHLMDGGVIRKVVELLLRIKELKRVRRAGDWQSEEAEGALIGVRRWRRRRRRGVVAISTELGALFFFFCGACDCQVGHFCALIRSLFPPLEADFFCGLFVLHARCNQPPSYCHSIPADFCPLPCSKRNTNSPSNNP